MKRSIWIFGLLGLISAGCGSEAAVRTAATDTDEIPASVTAVTVTLTPLEATLAPGAEQQFEATVEGTDDTGVTWRVKESGGGTISETGLYTAPAAEGAYHVVAASTADPNATAEATVTVKAASGGNTQSSRLSISPASATVEISGAVSLSATFDGQNVKNNEVEWTATSGTVNNGGNYTAPVTPGTYTITATLVADPSQKASSKITVKAPVIKVVIWPGYAKVETGGATAFAAAISGSAFNGLTFSIQEGLDGGYIIPTTGLYTAPATPGTYHVVATSKYDSSKKSVATVTVHEITPYISIDPVKVGVLAEESFDFTAAVTNTRFTDYEFSLPDDDSGSITEGGEYTAPATPGTYRVVVSSNYDSSVSATATVVVNVPYCPSGARVIDYSMQDENGGYPETTFYARLEYSAYPTQESHVQLFEFGILGLPYYAHAVTTIDIAVAPGEDDIWETNDDELGFRYKLTYDNNGHLIRYADMVSGPDGKIGTADDIERGGQIFWWDGTYLEVSAFYESLGIDGDSVANGEITEVWKYDDWLYQWRPQQKGNTRYAPQRVHHFTSPGPDGQWDLDDCINCGEDDSYTSWEHRPRSRFWYNYSGTSYAYRNNEFPDYQNYFARNQDGSSTQTYQLRHYYSSSSNGGLYSSGYYRYRGNGRQVQDAYMSRPGSHTEMWMNTFYYLNFNSEENYYAEIRTCP